MGWGGGGPAVLRSRAFQFSALAAILGSAAIACCFAGQAEDRLSPHVGSQHSSSSVFLLLSCAEPGLGSCADTLLCYTQPLSSRMGSSHHLPHKIQSAGAGAFVYMAFRTVFSSGASGGGLKAKLSLGACRHLAHSCVPAAAACLFV